LGAGHVGRAGCMSYCKPCGRQHIPHPPLIPGPHKTKPQPLTRPNPPPTNTPSAVERLYGEAAGPQVVELLRRSPAAAAPVVLPRLEQKQREWREVGGGVWGGLGGAHGWGRGGAGG
jgi:hypothetical protein